MLARSTTALGNDIQTWTGCRQHHCALGLGCKAPCKQRPTLARVAVRSAERSVNDRPLPCSRSNARQLAT